jgi:hypothetical protein
MGDQHGYHCAVCRDQSKTQRSGYLLMARRNPSRILILHWNPALASYAEANFACSPEHALELVAHWMVSGRLDLNFTQPDQEAEGPTAENTDAIPAASVAGYRPIGEVVIDRHIVRELVAKDPEALTSVLDSLLEAMMRDKVTSAGRKPARSSLTGRRAGIA